MVMSLANAIRNIKQDEKWISKIIVYGCVLLAIPIGCSFAIKFIDNETAPGIDTLIGIIIYIVGYIWCIGFQFSTANKTMNSDKFQMAELNEKNLMLTGLKAVAAMIVWGILAELLLVVILIFYIILIAIISLIIFGIVKLIGIDYQVFRILASTFAALSGVALVLYAVQFVNNAFVLYFKRLEFVDMLSLNKYFVIIKENKHANWTLIGKQILYVLALIGIITGLTVTIVGSILVPFVLAAGVIVGNNLIVQYAKQINIEKYLEA